MSHKGSAEGWSGGRQEARLRTILDAMVEAVFVTDSRGRVILTNQALNDLVSRDVRGRRARNVIKSKELRAAIRRARKKDKATEVELESVIGDQLRSFHAQVSPLPNGEGVVTVLHDVTSLRQADRVRRDFVANASHELRTPLTAILGCAETLQDADPLDPQVRHRFLDAILRHTRRLQRLAEDLSVLAQAESPAHDFERESVDVRLVCRDSLLSLESFARRKEMELRLQVPEAPVVVHLSPRALDHVLINLIENAIKYAPAGTPVRIEVEQQAEQLSIAVKDRGPGIAPAYHQRVFERFYRLDLGRSREDGGTGLGLSIVKHLVTRMGGSIALESEVGQGSTFRVVFPMDVLRP
jgi:two-component system phosphate regulon sensor histidine kinase PhoR